MIAKNSIKIRSFCFGMNFSGVGVKGTTVESVVTAVGIDGSVGLEGSGVIDFSCGAAQETTTRLRKKRKM